MLRFVTLAVLVAIASSAPNPYQNVFQIDISPEEAQKYLANPPFTEPQLSGRTAVLPLVKYNDPRFRNAEAGPTLGHYWKNGKEIENTEDYQEEVYDASQYHGQDGLGAYVYGYETPESAKVENRVRSGDVTGSYTYKAGSSNDLIKVRYWADSQGFHQEDNLPKVVLKPQEEAPDVREARLAHEKAWAEAAAAARKQPDPQGEYNPAYDYQPQASEQQASYAAAPSVSQNREGKAYSNQGSYQTGVQSGFPSTTPKYNEETEPTGPPRGFFYSFNYPVSIIVPKNQENPNYSNYPGNQDTVSINSARQ